MGRARERRGEVKRRDPTKRATWRREYLLLTLQRRAGNAAVSQLLKDRSFDKVAVQLQAEATTTSESIVGATKVAESARTLAVIRVVGHASPRWRGATTSSEANARNMHLSERRAEAVRLEVEHDLRLLLPGRDLVFRYDYTPSDPSNEPANVVLGSEARGSTETLSEAGELGPKANEPQMRRVEVRVSLHSATQTDVEEESEHYERRSAATTDWSIRVTGQTGASVLGKAGGLVIELKNEKTGALGEYLGFYAGLGAEVDVSIAQGSPSWSPFKTPTPMSFADFSASHFEIWSAGAGFGVGGQWAKLHFISFGNDAPVPKEGIYVGGWTFGSFGAGASIVGGDMFLIGHPPETMTIPVRITRERRYSSTMEETMSHRVLFDTGSWKLKAPERERLAAYLLGVAIDWQ